MQSQHFDVLIFRAGLSDLSQNPMPPLYPYSQVTRRNFD